MSRNLSRRLDGLEQREPDELPASLLEWLGETTGRSHRSASIPGIGMDAASASQWLSERKGESA